MKEDFLKYFDDAIAETRDAFNTIGDQMDAYDAFIVRINKATVSELRTIARAQAFQITTRQKRAELVAILLDAHAKTMDRAALFEQYTKLQAKWKALIIARPSEIA